MGGGGGPFKREWYRLPVTFAAAPNPPTITTKFLKRPIIPQKTLIFGDSSKKNMTLCTLSVHAELYNVMYYYNI